MPELPEVEVVRLGISPFIIGKKIIDVAIRHTQLRWPIPLQLKTQLVGLRVQDIIRRGKYLLFILPTGTLIWHLGMSGSMRILTGSAPPKKHDHVDLCFPQEIYLRFNDPRRFGALLWTEQDPLQHPLLATLGPEPFSNALTGKYLWQKAQHRKIPIKAFLMNSKIVVGVGNIYAAEVLFAAQINPLTPAQQISREQFKILSRGIKNILGKAVKKGGTTLKDFVNSDGKPGYFKQHLHAYGRAGKTCSRCGTVMEQIWIAQRGTVFCPGCQK